MMQIRRISRYAVPLALALSAGVPDAAAQDAQYWTNQYGTTGNLIGGAVVGSVADLSAVFYNPGAVSLITDPELIATSHVFEAVDVSIDGRGELNIDLNDLSIGNAPGFFAGLIPLNALGKHTIGYSFLTRYKFDAELRAAGSGTADLLGDGTDEDYYVELGFTSRLNESWAGLTWSYPLGRRFGIGVSTFVTIRSQRARSAITGQAFQSPGTTGGVTQSDLGYKYNHYGILWKAGLTYDWLGFSLGATVTTPRIKVFGSGETLVNRLVVGQDADGDGTPDPLFIADVQSDLPAIYKSPFSLAGGASKMVGRNTTLHATVEWFNDVPLYDVMLTEPFVGQSTGDTLQADVTQELEDVINFGIGVEERFTPGFSLMASFRTDNSALTTGEITDVSVASWNIYFVTVGSTFRLGGGEFTLGLAYGFGGEDPTKFMENPPDDEIIEPLPDDARIRYSSLRFIIAFSF
jgi:hypothetical protein